MDRHLTRQKTGFGKKKKKREGDAPFGGHKNGPKKVIERIESQVGRTCNRDHLQGERVSERGTQELDEGILPHIARRSK